MLCCQAKVLIKNQSTLDKQVNVPGDTVIVRFNLLLYQLQVAHLQLNKNTNNNTTTNN